MERLVQFDTAHFCFREMVQSALGHTNLEKLHHLEPEELLSDVKPLATSTAGADERGGGRATFEWQRRRVEKLRHACQERWKRSDERRAFEAEWLPRLIRDVIGPACFPAERTLLYQRAPMLRFHVAWPAGDSHDGGDAGAANDADVAEPGSIAYSNSSFAPDAKRVPGALTLLHSDGQPGYDHPEEEVNFLLPVTLLTGTCASPCGSNSLWVESAPGVADFAPLELRYGEIAEWHGNTCRHYSHRNASQSTRVSFDFRVIAGSRWEARQERQQARALGQGQGSRQRRIRGRRQQRDGERYALGAYYAQLNMPA